MRITMLMPNLPPLVCGLADHGVNLGEAFRKLGAETSYLGLRGGADDGGGSDMYTWNGSTNDLIRMLRQLSTEVLWVQYSGYGFSKRGIPIGLARTIEVIRKSNSDLKIAVCMHETHASKAGLGWCASLIQPLQISVGRRIARVADVLFATVDVNLDRCVGEYGISPTAISLLPIASNIPTVRVRDSDRVALREQLNLHKNARIAVIFGLWATQLRTMKLFREHLESSLRIGQIDHVLAVGGDTGPCQKNALTEQGRALNGHFTVYGPASGPEIGRILRCCDVGLVPTPLAYLRKSGVAAAFSAAKLELWLKNERAEIMVKTNIEPFPTWDQVAGMAMESLQVRTTDCGYAYR
jgi:hypothetical protein